MVVGPGTETSGGSSDTKVGTVDQGGEIAEHGKSGRALGDCGETESDGAVGVTVAGQGTSAIGSGGETVGWATMSRRQRKAWLRGRK